MTAFAIGVDLGGTNLRAAAVDTRGKILEKITTGTELTITEFDLVTPTALAISEPVDMVVVPGAEGDIGALPGHTPLITTLRAGQVDVYNGGQITQSFAVTGGFAEVTPERVTVLAESIETSAK